MHTRISITGDRPEGRWAGTMGNGLAAGEKRRFNLFHTFSGLSFTARVLFSTLINQKQTKKM